MGSQKFSIRNNLKEKAKQIQEENSDHLFPGYNILNLPETSRDFISSPFQDGQSEASRISSLGPIN